MLNSQQFTLIYNRNMKNQLLAFNIDPAVDFNMDNWMLGGYSD